MASKIEAATQWIIKIANDNSHGYDQDSRWGNPDYDCSSLVISAWEQAGVPVKSKGGATYTGNMLNAFKNNGFTDVTAKVNLSTGSGLQRGDVLLNVANHTAMYIGNGQIASAHYNENGGSRGGQPGDQTGKEINVSGYYNSSNSPWEYVLRYTAGGTAPEEKPGTGDTMPSSGPTMQYGSSGSNVKTLQKRLILLGYNVGDAGADGDFGASTQTAVKSFQSQHGLSADGIFGPLSWAAMAPLYNALNIFDVVSVQVNLKVRTGPGTNYPVLATYPAIAKGEVIKISKVLSSGKWYYGLAGNRYRAYVMASLTKKK